ncbi:MAG: MerR family transcriptional regulator [Corynebacterium sp.]|nr:MerR family transcriptional regulator [Corynebacterium sp.]
MKISEAADIVGCSVRTIRHYHDLGLMPIPARHGAWRDYGFDDVARLIQIRSMVQAGIALSDVKTKLDSLEESETSVYDQTLASLDQQIAELQQQRARLLEMKHRTITNSPALSQAVHDQYTKVEDILRDEGEYDGLEFIRKEHKLASMFSELGFFKTDFDLWSKQLDPVEMAEFIKGLMRLKRPDWTMADVEKLTEDSIYLHHGLPNMPRSAYKLARRFIHNRAAEKLCLLAYPEPGMQMFIKVAFARFREEFP